MLIVAGRVFVDPSQLEEFVAESRSMMPIAAVNPGCILMSFALDDPEVGSMLVLEKWRDQASLDAHLARPEVVRVFAKWTGLMHNEVRKYDAFNERDVSR